MFIGDIMNSDSPYWRSGDLYSWDQEVNSPVLALPEHPGHPFRQVKFGAVLVIPAKTPPVGQQWKIQIDIPNLSGPGNRVSRTIFNDGNFQQVYFDQNERTAPAEDYLFIRLMRWVNPDSGIFSVEEEVVDLWGVSVNLGSRTAVPL